ncbi:glycerol dehydratase reactivase beta/small subunit family protein [Buttiauxella noackiae]|uniref:glycerol dehydratase reactivase beta/small subunit family protein n=1 Tax=Buttiauxella noackiae TaxID=82992 RepID=UPI0028D3CB07|nr:glycerol dehydratase reactivase beta/small subunit family protein [Buttiauxella noackiae]
MDSRQEVPAIVITAIGECQALWQEVLWGIEEEGIPWRWQLLANGELNTCAWQAASRSPLLVGIACNVKQLVIHYRNLPASAPLFTLTLSENNLARRNAGNNAARLVKGIPFR